MAGVDGEVLVPGSVGVVGVVGEVGGVEVPEPGGEVIVPSVELLDDSEALVEEELLDDELDGGGVLCIDGAVVAIEGVPPVTLPGGGSCAIGCPSSAPAMNAFQIVSGIVAPVTSP